MIILIFVLLLFATFLIVSPLVTLSVLVILIAVGVYILFPKKLHAIYHKIESHFLSNFNYSFYLLIESTISTAMFEFLICATLVARFTGAFLVSLIFATGFAFKTFFADCFAFCSCSTSLT